MVGVEQAKRTIESQADLSNVEIETVEYVEDDSTGDTFRVLETDGETEAEQVGFQISYPEGPLSDRMFKDRLKQYFDALRERQRNDGDESSSNQSDTDVPDPDPPTEYEDTSGQDETDGPDSESADGDRAIEAQAGSQATVRQPDESFALDVSIDPESIAELRDELETVHADTQKRAELEARLDDVEDRLETVESALEALSAIGSTQE